jgi:hypothetical protein
MIRLSNLHNHVSKRFWRFYELSIGVVSHIRKFGDASKSLEGDTAPAAGDSVVSHWRCIISFRDAHPPHSHPHLPQETPHLPREMCSHLQIAGYVTLLIDWVVNEFHLKWCYRPWWYTPTLNWDLDALLGLTGYGNCPDSRRCVVRIPRRFIFFSILSLMFSYAACPLWFTYDANK